MRISIAIILILIAGFIPASAQVAGCTDSLANNYNNLATQNDGSCTYNPTFYTPMVKVNPINEILKETSGLQWAANALWTFNDSGGEAALYQIDTLTDAILQTVNLQGATNIDWEDIAFDGAYFYIGDFGNNATGGRTDLKIYKFLIAAIPPAATNPIVNIAAEDIEIIQFTYSDQPQPVVPTGSNNTDFDCEAMLVDEGAIHLFTKRWASLGTTHYVIPNTAAGSYVAEALETLPTNYLVTAADKPIGQDVIALMGYQNSGSASHFMHLLSDYTGHEFFSGNKRIINLPDVTLMGQGEGLTFRNAKYGYISNERFERVVFGFTINITPKLQAFDISNFLSTFQETFIFSGNGDWDTAANWLDCKTPPNVLDKAIQIIINPVANGECVLKTPFSLNASSKLTVVSGKNFVVNGNLQILH